MRDWFLRFQCWVLGYSYDVIKFCSAASHKAVKKYFSAVLIVTTLWFFIGAAFADRYLGVSLSVSIGAGFLMALIVLQIERQIILSSRKRGKVLSFRVVTGVLMAFIGSVILDQFVFREDINTKKIDVTQERVNKSLPAKSGEIDRQTSAVSEQISAKEAARGSDRRNLQETNDIGGFH
ncbi:MAG: hypothetical protein C4325_00155 [Blastocatellia bacterium]